MTETLASALRYVDLSRQQTQKLPPQQLSSVPAQQHQPILQDFMTPQRPMHQAQQQPPQYAQDHAMALKLAQQLNPPTTETERRHFFTTLQGCYPDFNGSIFHENPPKSHINLALIFISNKECEFLFAI